MEKLLKQLKDEAIKKITNIKDINELINIKKYYLGKNSQISKMMHEIKNISDINKKKENGKNINEVYIFLQDLINKKNNEINENKINEKLKNEKIDIFLPSNGLDVIGINPLYIIEEKIINLFLKMGYHVYESNDIDNDHYNFELLNIPKDHPARDMQDTFYIDNFLLMCTHTSHSQAHAMEEAKGQPIRIISPGKCFRRDDDDSIHSHQFMQIEGLLIDKEKINLGHLKKTIEILIDELFDSKRLIRFRNSFFPFTEPSIEVDINCDKCNGKGCHNCKNTGYIEVLGAGIVNPNVLIMNGYDPKKYSGFAFGIGIDRIAILKYGIDDIRNFYLNDIRFLNEFKMK